MEQLVYPESIMSLCVSILSTRRRERERERESGHSIRISPSISCTVRPLRLSNYCTRGGHFSVLAVMSLIIDNNTHTDNTKVQRRLIGPIWLIAPQMCAVGMCSVCQWTCIMSSFVPHSALVQTQLAISGDNCCHTALYCTVYISDQ